MEAIASYFLFVNAAKIYQFKVKISEIKVYEIKVYALCLGKISKDSTISNMKKQV